MAWWLRAHLAGDALLETARDNAAADVAAFAFAAAATVLIGGLVAFFLSGGVVSVAGALLAGSRLVVLSAAGPRAPVGVNERQRPGGKVTGLGGTSGAPTLIRRRCWSRT